jgi:hypothetical protein
MQFQVRLKWQRHAQSAHFVVSAIKPGTLTAHQESSGISANAQQFAQESHVFMNITATEHQQFTQ